MWHQPVHGWYQQLWCIHWLLHWWFTRGRWSLATSIQTVYGRLVSSCTHQISDGRIPDLSIQTVNSFQFLSYELVYAFSCTYVALRKKFLCSEIDSVRTVLQLEFGRRATIFLWTSLYWISHLERCAEDISSFRCNCILSFSNHACANQCSITEVLQGSRSFIVLKKFFYFTVASFESFV